MRMRSRDRGREREYLENLVAEFKEQGKRKRGFEGEECDAGVPRRRARSQCSKEKQTGRGGQTGGRRINWGLRKLGEGCEEEARHLFCFNSTSNTRKWWEILVANKIIYLVSNRFYFGLTNGWCFY